MCDDRKTLIFSTETVIYTDKEYRVLGPRGSTSCDRNENDQPRVGQLDNISTIDDSVYKGDLFIYFPMTRFANHDGAHRSQQKKK